MKKSPAVLVVLLAASFLTLFTPKTTWADERPFVSVVREGIRFSESVYPYDGGLFISNFGSEHMTPGDGENKGYILYRKNGKTKTVIPADGNLHKPTAMVVKDGCLFVCDETRLLVYEMEKLSKAPQIVTFPAEDTVVNAIVADGDTLYISVTNTGRIYSLDISHPKDMENVKPQKWLEINGPNGMAISNGAMYIATIPEDYRSVQPEHVVYRVRDMKHPKAEKFAGEPGLHDGVAVSDGNRILYLSDWKTASVMAIDIQTKETRVMYKEPGIGPADIAQADGILYIPDLPNSRIIEINVGK